MSNIDCYFVYLDNESTVKPNVKPQSGALHSEGIVFLFLPECGLMNDTSVTDLSNVKIAYVFFVITF